MHAGINRRRPSALLYDGVTGRDGHTYRVDRNWAPYDGMHRISSINYADAVVVGEQIGQLGRHGTCFPKSLSPIRVLTLHS
jgi:hypothetical protein